jgi:preprotein translocase subunit SecA
MIAEMKTGEGKTLVETLPAYLNALEGKGVHIVTVNDYLVKRDAEWMGKVYEFLGLTVACITNRLSEDERRLAYRADITYLTNNELGFDYLRDNMKYSREHFVQRPFNYAIVDEVDSILIDEARTPLVISGASDDKFELYYAVNKLIPKLSEEHYEIDEKSRSVSLTDAGVNKLESVLSTASLIKKGSGLFDIQNIDVLHHVNQALKAHKLFKNNTDYLVKDNQVMLIDEFTGRIMDGRRLSEGLHQAIEAKEGLPVQNETQTLASITFQNYFRLYPKLAGMTGTAMTEASEFKDIYGLEVVSIPTKNPIVRLDEDDIIYRTAEEKYEAIIDEIDRSHKSGQPILVGTVSIEKSEHISKLLKARRIEHHVLNAKHHEKEAQIIAQAGKPGAVTIATNMAGRGTDIKLGGNPEMLAREFLGTSDFSRHKKELKAIYEQAEKDKDSALQAGGLLVIGTERHESRRIDNQLRGRSGRLGDPGRTVFYLSLEDDLMRIFGSDKISSLLKTLGLKRGEAIFHSMISKTIAKAQQKVEARNFEIRKSLLKFDDVMNDQRKIIYEQRDDIMQSGNALRIAKDMFYGFNKECVDLYVDDSKLKEEWQLEDLENKITGIYGTKVSVKKFIKQTDRTQSIQDLAGTTETEASKLPNQKFERQMVVDSVSIESYLNEQSDKLIEEKIKMFGQAAFEAVAQRILLVTIDQFWREHLLALDHLRHGIYLRSFGQKDPLNEYKKEAFSYFSEMLNSIRQTYLSRLSRAEAREILDDDEMPEKDFSHFLASRMDPALAEGDANRLKDASRHNYDFDPTDERTWTHLGRNETCPCNSGKKYKFCHGKLK